jgi:hypothetical protein
VREKLAYFGAFHPSVSLQNEFDNDSWRKGVSLTVDRLYFGGNFNYSFSILKGVNDKERLLMLLY